MSYSINLTNGTSLISGGLSDGTIDNSHTSLTLIGKDYANYGKFINDNFVGLLENFANSSSPPNPLRGQLWWDVTNNILRVYSGQTWKISTGATSSPYINPPADLSALGGDLWFDTTNGQLKVYSGSTWIVVGPAATSATGNTGAVPTVMYDSSNGSHIVIQFLFNGTIYAVVSKDTFTTSNFPGFATIRAGINFSTVASPTWGLNTQDTNATAGTLVQRDTNGGITAGAITGTSLNAPASTVTTLNSTNIINSSTLQSSGTTTLSGTATLNGASILTASTNIIPNYTTTQIIALTPTIGLTVYNTTTGNVQIYNGSRWGNLVVS
jgi:hypothetical protein